MSDIIYNFYVHKHFCKHVLYLHNIHIGIHYTYNVGIGINILPYSMKLILHFPLIYYIGFKTTILTFKIKKKSTYDIYSNVFTNQLTMKNRNNSSVKLV